VKCMRCNKFGHNSRTCKGKSAADRQLPKGANKQKKTKGKGSSSGKAKAGPSEGVLHVDQLCSLQPQMHKLCSL